MSEYLLTAFPEPNILQVTLNRPESLNALNKELMDELNDLLFEAKENKKIKGILITGEGKAFCAGADIKQLKLLSGQSGVEFARNGQAIFRNLERLGKPTLAAINGYALGGGLELAMSATIRIAADTALFGQPEIKLGVIPGFGGTQRLARLIGKARALDLCLRGRNIKANDALNWGLITEVTPKENLIDRALEILKEIICFSPIALKSIMDAIDQGYDLNLNDAFELEAIHFGLCCSTKDKNEGVTAFIEKRTPSFCGE